MKRLKSLSTIIFLSISFLGIIDTLFAQEIEQSSDAYCYNAYLNGDCPKELCHLSCYGGIIFEGCEMGCFVKSCMEISKENCPLDKCQILEGCDKRDICFTKHIESECGGLAYFGNTPCCEGLEMRCGIEFFDGSCDMAGRGSIYGAPICIPCGDGVCTQFENRCNCPEDCGEPIK